MRSCRKGRRHRRRDRLRPAPKVRRKARGFNEAIRRESFFPRRESGILQAAAIAARSALTFFKIEYRACRACSTVAQAGLILLLKPGYRSENRYA